MESEYSYLWDGSSDEWALVHINADSPDELPRYMIANVKEKQALLISDDVLYAQLKQAMLDHGVKIVTVGDGF